MRGVESSNRSDNALGLVVAVLDLLAGDEKLGGWKRLLRISRSSEGVGLSARCSNAEVLARTGVEVFAECDTSKPL